MTRSNVSGFPRIGDRRELKVATERYWAGEASEDHLHDVARDIRRRNWVFLLEAGIDLVPSNDFSLYDQVLDTIALTGAVPERYRWDGELNFNGVKGEEILRKKIEALLAEKD